MAQDITVTLTNEQVAKGLEYARKVYPDASNDDLRQMLEDAAYWGPGVRQVIADWETGATRQDENENRQTARDEFLAVYPDRIVEPAPPVEE